MREKSPKAICKNYNYQINGNNSSFLDILAIYFMILFF